MKPDRFLTFILGGVLLLVILSLTVYFTRQQTLDYGEEDSPAGVVRNYVIALLKADYSKAYSYLKEGEFKPDETQFRQAFLTSQLDPRSVSLELGKVTIDDEIATVDLFLIRNANDPFGNSFTENWQATLRRDQNGKWKLESMPYPYWSWDWYNPAVAPPEPIPVPAGQD
ncbi:MAG: hypothetical protein DDG59_01520 [Anaerolineae bacterium]|jgi:hypothetical protein|nr:MAG: hypothetical protein DDG59_01520 [Anaerolineae bacterium]